MKKYIPIILKLIITIIFIQTLPFKFSGAEESIALFSKIAGKNEVLLRISTGVLELIAAILLFVKKRELIAITLSIGLMIGAIISHLTIIGIEHNNDNGALFVSAIIALIISITLLILVKKDKAF